MKKQRTLFDQIRGDNSEQEKDLGWRNSSLVRYMIFVLTIVLSSLFFPSTSNVLFKSSNTIESLVGLPWTNESIRAEYSFPVSKQKEIYDAECRVTKEQTPPVFVRSNVNTISLEQRNTMSSRLLQIKLQNYSEGERQNINTQLLRFIDTINGLASINLQKSQISSSIIFVANNKQTFEQIDVNTLLDSSELKSFIVEKIKEEFPFDLQSVIGDFILTSVRYSLLFSPTLTSQLQEANVRSVRSTSGLVRKGEIVVSKGEIITPELAQKLLAYGVLTSEKSGSTLVSTIGALGHAALIFSMFIVFLAFTRRQMFEDNLLLFGFGFGILVVCFLGWVSLRVDLPLPAEYLIILPCLSITVAILSDSRTAFYYSVILTLMLAGVRANDYATALSMLVSSTFGALTIQDFKSRSQIFRGILFIFLGFSLSILALNFERNNSFNQFYPALISALINSVTSILLTLVVLFGFEKLFKISTDLQLLELDDLSHPLLVEMSEKAPGTYQHTLMISTLVENAAHAIEARPILAKVGALFHDIGKIPKAEYFVENQINIGNKHDFLTPKKSVVIVKNHVTDGVELAREYKLPESIIDFIPQHHGTTLIKFFWSRAKELANDESTLLEGDFRYLGPKPQTKEAAILMLADSVEAVSRVLDSDDKDVLEETIDKIVFEKIQDGQFDECDISMLEIQAVKDSFVKSLLGVKHQRVQYKEG